jgi:alpha-galactosidase
VTETLLETYCSIIEQWLNDAENRVAGPDSSQATITPNDELAQTLDQIKDDIEAGNFVVTDKDRPRLTAIVSRFAKLENHSNAQLRWFHDLAMALRDKSEK